jgi:hypothetical protein
MARKKLPAALKKLQFKKGGGRRGTAKAKTRRKKS